MTDTELLTLLYSALAEPIGLLLDCSDPSAARAALYAARKRAQDPALAELQFLLRPALGGLCICKQKIERVVFAQQYAQDL